MKITQIDQELQQIVSSAKEGDERLIAAEIVNKQRELELDKLKTQRMLRQVRMLERVEIEQMGSRLQNLNMWLAPAVILLIAIVLSIRRSFLRRYYVSHASDS
jgi:capsular polysaccharide biosynthesis protein